MDNGIAQRIFCFFVLLSSSDWLGNGAGRMGEFLLENRSHPSLKQKRVPIEKLKEIVQQAIN